MPLDVFYEVGTLRSSGHLLGCALSRFVHTDRVLSAPFGFTPYLPYIQAFSIDAYDGEFSQFLASRTQEYWYAQPAARPQRCAIHRIDI